MGKRTFICGRCKQCRNFIDMCTVCSGISNLVDHKYLHKYGLPSNQWVQVICKSKDCCKCSCCKCKDKENDT